MKRPSTRLSLKPLVLLSTLLLLSAPLVARPQFQSPLRQHPFELAAVIDDEKRPARLTSVPQEKSSTSWAFAFDNDLLTPFRRDQDYTYGLSFTYTGSRSKSSPLTLHKGLALVDQWLRVDRLSDRGPSSQSIELGLFGFTPEDTKQDAANPLDRPYASLVYLSSVREQLNRQEQVAWKTTLTLGVLGVDWVGELQNEFHDQIHGDEIAGWDNQISDGGELTARYSIARQRRLGEPVGNTEFKSTLQASVGYLTEASWSLSLRSGRFHTLWSSFNPELTSYGEKSTPTTRADSVPERYLWAGFAFKARLYNAFLEGQLRDSAVTYNRGDLNLLLVEAWLGYTFAFNRDYRLSYVLRGHSSEIEDGAGDRALVWGGLILARTFRG